MGQIILVDGIPQKDPLSYTMSNYNFIAHEWLSEVALAILYPKLGMAGLAFVFTSIIILTFIIGISLIPKNAHRWILVPLFLSLSLIMDFVSIRAQVISWLFFAVLIKLLFSGVKFKKRIIFTSIILLLWVNTHGSFALGVGLVMLFSLVNIFKKRGENFKEGAVIVASLLVTFINPYGMRIWEESIMTLGDGYLRAYIIEWQTAIFQANPLFWILVGLSCYFVFKYRGRYDPKELIMFSVLCMLSITSIKQTPFFVLFSMPLLTKGLYWLYEEAGRVKFGKIRFNKLYQGLAVLVFLMCLPYVIYILYRTSDFGEKASYPIEATKFLSKNYPTGRMFTLYRLGGYVNLRLPGYKVFVNGMMPIWKNHKFKGESSYAFKEYREIMSGELSFADASSRYDIDTLILLPEGKEDSYTRLGGQAIKAGMVVVYEKDGVVIYRKQKYMLD